MMRWQPLRFVLVGGLNTAIAYALYALFVALGWPVAAASLGSLLLSVPIGFLTQGTMVFGGARARQLPRFIAAWALIYLANVAALWMLMRLGLNAYAAGAVALVPITVLSFVLQRGFVFGR